MARMSAVEGRLTTATAAPHINALMDTAALHVYRREGHATPILTAAKGYSAAMGNANNEYA